MRPFLWIALCLYVQYGNTQPERLYFNHITQTQGLSQTTNYFVYKDSYGFVWINSLNGLNRFDGQQVRVYYHQEDDPNSLPDNNIQSRFFEDKNHNLWFTTYEALVCYDRIHDHFISYPKMKNVISQKGYHFAIMEDDLKLGIIVNGRALYLFDLKKRKWFDSPLLNFPINMVRAFPLYNNSDLLEGMIAFNFGVPGFYFFNIKSSQEATYQIRFDGKNEKEPAFHFTDVIKMGDTLLLGAREGFLTLSCKNTAYWKFDPTNDWHPNRFSFYKKKILASLNGGGWWLTDFIDPQIGTRYFHKPNDPWSLASNNTYGISIDKEGVIWTGVTGIGVDFTQPEKQKFKLLNVAELFGIKDRTIGIHALVEDQNGNIWCSSRSDGIFVLSPNLEPLVQYSRFSSGANKIPGDIVPYIFSDSKNRQWIVTYSWLGVREKENSKTIVTDKRLASLFGIELLDKRILFSQISGGISQLIKTAGRFDFIQLPQFEIHNFFTHLYQNRRGWLYVNKDISSILIVDPEKNFETIKELSIKKEVFSYYEELNSNIIWIATKNGLVRLNQENWKLKTFTVAHGLPDQQIYSVIGDDMRTLWLTTNRGMVRFFIEEERFQVFSIFDGLQGFEYNSNSFLKRSNGEFWFGGTHGINIFKPNEVKNLQVKPNPTITDIIINNESSPDYLEDAETKTTNVSLIKKLVLDNDQNDLIFNVAALEYSDPSANEYRFQMVVDRDTIVRKGKKHTFEYPNMQPGNYALIYNASNSDGVWFEDREKRLDITINPPWYETWWARTLFLLIIIGGIYAYYRYRIAQIQKEARYKQLIAETETAVLRLQMNPHFIFNSLNSINGYLLQKDKYAASNYLGQFATLMRKVLDFSAEPLIEVGDEIEILELYMQAESMRFPGKFKYSLPQNEDLDIMDCLIPPMLLQPFVENSILHGFNKHTQNGQIDVQFWEKDDGLYCSVSDNGMGRQAAAQKNTRAKTHESKALEITKRRLELLKTKKGITPSLEIIDLKDKNNRPAGTKVLLRLPVL